MYMQCTLHDINNKMSRKSPPGHLPNSGNLSNESERSTSNMTAKEAIYMCKDLSSKHDKEQSNRELLQSSYDVKAQVNKQLEDDFSGCDERRKSVSPLTKVEEQTDMLVMQEHYKSGNSDQSSLSLVSSDLEGQLYKVSNSLDIKRGNDEKLQDLPPSTDNEGCDHTHRSSENVVEHADNPDIDASAVHTNTSKDEQYSCPKCNATFTNLSEFTIHLWIHSGVESSQASKRPGCSSLPSDSSKNKSSRSSNSSKPSSVNKEDNMCVECGVAFCSVASLARHMMIHRDERPHECPVCQQHFRLAASLADHMLRHTGERPHKCIFCEKTFVQTSSLSQHIRIHTGEKSYKCSVCDTYFRHSSSLSQHMRIHTGEKAYKCSFCDKSFRHSSGLSQHVRIHTGARPHPCSQCNKAFRNSSHLAKHMRLHTGEKPYRCEICSKCFSRSDHLAGHKLTHKKDKQDKKMTSPEKQEKSVSTKKQEKLTLPEEQEKSASLDKQEKEEPIPSDDVSTSYNRIK